MPKYKKKKYAKKKYAYHKKRAAKPVSQISYSPIAKSQLVRLKYCQRFRLDPNPNGTTGDDDSLVFRSFRINSAFDPDYDNTTAGVGEQRAGNANHQPYGFDQWSAFYNHYRVVGAKFNVKFWNQNLDNIIDTGTDVATIVSGETTSNSITRGHHESNQGVYVGLHFDNDANPESTITHAKETNKYKFRTLLPGQSTTMSRNWSLKKWIKNEGSKSEDIDLWGNVTSSNPAETAFAHLICAGLTTKNVDCMPVDVEIMIDQIVLFSDLREITQS